MKYFTLENNLYFDSFQWLKLLAINTLIAIFLTLAAQTNFWINIIYSQSIGISIASLICLIALKRKGKEPSIFLYGVAIILGVIIGITFASLIVGGGKIVDGENGRDIMMSSIIYSTMIGCIVVFYFVLIEKQQKISNQLNVEKLKQVEYERMLTENNLKLLQAQIEPHFLFNTLSNVLGLIDGRPDDAKKMLEHFTHYLRASLSRTRENNTTLIDEINIINAYLNIQKIRMGKRLNFNIEVDERLNDIPFPPLLIQPLVENSIRHGLESDIEGGKVEVKVVQDNDMLSIKVYDTGKGAMKLKSEGIGLKNIRERLRSLFQDRAELKTEANNPKGLIVILNIPLEKI